MADRASLLTTLAEQRSELESRYRAMDIDVLTTACTPSEDPDGAPWSPKDHLAHLLRIETAFLEMAKSTIGGDAAPVRICGLDVRREVGSSPSGQ